MAIAHQADEPDRQVFDAALREACGALGVEAVPEDRARMYAHFREMVKANEQFNLTRITAPAEAAVKHYADSLALLAAPWLDVNRPLNVLDVGTGAGFPGIPLAIARPHWRITAIDGTGKKARFAAEVAATLKLDNVEVLHCRAADLVRSRAGTFDLVLLRAVGKIGPGLRETHRLARPGGAVVFYKTAGIKAGEISEGRGTAERLGLQEMNPFRISLPTPEGPLCRQLIGYRRRSTEPGARALADVREPHRSG